MAAGPVSRARRAAAAAPQTRGRPGGRRGSSATFFTRADPIVAPVATAPRTAGMDFYVCLERKGFRVARRRRCKARVGAPHRISKEDAIKWFQQKFEGVVLEKHTETIY